MEQVRIGVVGAGRLGGFHASKAAKHSSVQLAGVVDVCQENRERLATQFQTRAFATPEELLPHVDAVILATPSILHASLARKLLMAGKHLLVEKPIATSASTALELAHMASSRGLVLQCGHVEQYNPAWKAALARLSDVRAGVVPAYIEAKRASGYTFRSTDVGATLDLMIHDLELILSLIPSEVENVSAFGVTQFGGHEDAAFATLEFANGSIARLSASRIEMTPVRHMTIRQASQCIDVNFATRTATLITPSVHVLSGQYSPEKVCYAQIAPRVPNFMQEEYAQVELTHEPFDALELEMSDFVNAIMYGAPSTVPGTRAAKAVAVAEMVIEDLQRRADRSGQTRRLRAVA
ncbi:MAG: Gfo/Idh/MocA family oxidoreductase [Planctomycetia bacterium]|nr:Gfo/Idh/MocA family oxidoreductase [Planctomycetia bacterium]